MELVTVAVLVRVLLALARIATSPSALVLLARMPAASLIWAVERPSPPVVAVVAITVALLLPVRLLWPPISS
jgi:hypothetical protein